MRPPLEVVGLGAADMENAIAQATQDPAEVSVLGPEAFLGIINKPQIILVNTLIGSTSIF